MLSASLFPSTATQAVCHFVSTSIDEWRRGQQKKPSLLWGILSAIHAISGSDADLTGSTSGFRAAYTEPLRLAKHRKAYLNVQGTTFRICSRSFGRTFCLMLLINHKLRCGSGGIVWCLFLRMFAYEEFESVGGGTLKRSQSQVTLCTEPPTIGRDSKYGSQPNGDRKEIAFNSSGKTVIQDGGRHRQRPGWIRRTSNLVGGKISSNASKAYPIRNAYA